MLIIVHPLLDYQWLKKEILKIKRLINKPFTLLKKCVKIIVINIYSHELYFSKKYFINFLTCKNINMLDENINPKF